jgi:hypothetical protein
MVFHSIDELQCKSARQSNVKSEIWMSAFTDPTI